MLNYTKGEWKVCNCNGTYMPTADIHILGVGSTEEEQCVATLSYQHKEDAQLIASAPDLYEALKELADIMECVIEAPDVAQLDSFTLQPARQALAKAEGK